MPLILKVLLSLSLILVLHGIFRHLLAAILAGTAVLAAWCGFSAGEGFRIAWDRFASTDNLLLMVVILQVTWLSTQLSKARIMTDLVEAVRRRLPRRAAMAALPAVIGFLPMPGGALFSAPLVDRCDPEGMLDPLLKVRANYWFRHIWEYWWPLYPGVLLALDLTGLEVWQFMLLQLPFSLVAVGAGYLFILRRIAPDRGSVRDVGSGGDVETARGDEPKGQREPAPALLPLLTPILIVVAVYTIIKTTLPIVAVWHAYLPLMLGILAAALYVQVRRPLDHGAWQEILLSRKTLTMALLVAAVQVYGAFIEADLPGGMPLVAAMREELARWGIPALAMMMILPFVAGLTTGLTIGFVGASFPIVLGLAGDGGVTAAYLGTVSLAFVCGFAGMILSPVHICLIVTNEHFRTRLPASLPGLARPAAVVVLAALGLYWVLRGWTF